LKGIVLGTAGHVDHGKTALVRALTGVETDRWAEERERGLTIDIGFAPLHVDADLEVGVVDVPGHEDFVKNMLVGSTGIDAVLLVVAADEGPMPQTREHLSIARLLGVRHGIVALNKVDRVEPEWRELARDATLEESGRILGHRDWPVVEVSTLTGEGLTELRAHILDLANELPARPEEDVFRMPVDRAFSVAGAGTVVTGTTWSGRVTTGDTVRLLPVDLRARVRSLQVHGSDRDSVGPGSRAALALVGVETSRATRGAVVVSGAAWRSHRRFGARIESAPGVPS
jgi:selenocysteine-specific elongation factor